MLQAVLKEPTVLLNQSLESAFANLSGKAGITMEQALAFPRMLHPDWTRKLDQKIVFLHALMKENLENAKEHPIYYSMNFETEILPRFGYLQHLGLPTSLENLCASSDLAFVERLGVSFGEYLAYRTGPKGLGLFNLILAWYDADVE
eukprot:scaffold270_cov347-Pavlova_lutheri.AAC.26